MWVRHEAAWNPATLVDFTGLMQITCSTIAEVNDQWDWFQARSAYIPGESPVCVTMNQTRHRFTHDYCDVYQSISRDDGTTWSAPAAVASLRRVETADGYAVAGSDFWTQWHARSGMILSSGVSFYFAGGRHEHHLRHRVAYAVMDPQTETWGPLRELELPERDHASQPMLAQSAGCSQRVDLPDGDVLLPIVYMPSSDLDENEDTFDFSDERVLYNSIVARCGFDGQTLTYKEHGTEHSISRDHSRRLAARRGVEFSARGLCEPSLATFDGAFFLTMRSDHSAFVTKSVDGIHFEEVRGGPSTTAKSSAATAPSSTGRPSAGASICSTTAQAQTTTTSFAIGHRSSSPRWIPTGCK